MSAVVVIACVSVVTSGVADAMLRGTRLWTSRFDGSAAISDGARSLAVSPDGARVFVTGRSSGIGSGYDYVTIGYRASSGDALWERRYDGSSGRSDEPTSLAVSPDGTNVFVTGSSETTTGSDYTTIAYDALTGARLWGRHYSGDVRYGYDRATSIAVSPNAKTVFVTGYTFDATGEYNYATVAYTASTGAVRWTRHYNGPANIEDFGASIASSPDGTQVFVTGSSRSPGSTDYATVAYDASTGATLWVRRYNGGLWSSDDASGAEVATTVATGAEGMAVFVTGTSIRAIRSVFATIAYEASTGRRLWAKRYEGFENGGGYNPLLAANLDSRRVFVAGTSVGSNGSDYATVAYVAATGRRLWAKRYLGGDYVRSVALSPDGTKVFVTGSPSWPEQDYTTIAYGAAAGRLLWARRYNGIGDGPDVAYSIAASPTGNAVFVTGESMSSTSTDFTTIAYRT